MSVSITDERDLPVPDASISLSGPTSASATADLSGSASLPDLVPGAYQLTVTKPDFTDHVAELTVTAGESSVSLTLLTPIDWGAFAFDLNLHEAGAAEPPPREHDNPSGDNLNDDSSDPSGGSLG